MYLRFWVSHHAWKVLLMPCRRHEGGDDSRNGAGKSKIVGGGRSMHRGQMSSLPSVALEIEA